MIRTTTPAVLARFDALCAVVQAGRRGLTLQQLGAAHALAQELEAPEPDRDRVITLLRRLGLEDADDLLAELRDV